VREFFAIRIPTFLGISIISLPLVALLTKVSWLHLFANVWLPNSRKAIWLTLWTSTMSLLITVLIGIPLAWSLSRGKGSFHKLVRTIVLSPIVLPPTVAGLALIALLGRSGMLGKYIYEWTGWAIPFTSTAVVIAGVFVGLPFMTLICESAFRQLPKEVEDAAVVDRADEELLFRMVAVPQVTSAIVVGGVLAWARTLGEFGATLMFAGSLPGSTQTWSMIIYQYLDIDLPSAYALATVLLLVAVVVVFALRNALGRAFR
jgi:molybdate transport system permease protein